MLVKLLLLLSLAVPAFAETRTYLVNRADNFPQDRFLATKEPDSFKTFASVGEQTLNEAAGQPFKLTRYVVSFDGKYALWNVTPVNEEELKYLDSMVKQGYITLIATLDVVPTYKVRLGGYTNDIVDKTFGELPRDYYAVDVSTPG